jgi:hypothetical protein
MKKHEIKRLKIKDEISCAPEPYCGIPNLSDDYDVSAMIMNIKDQRVIGKVMQSLNCEEDYFYGPSSGYKGSFSYNRDD